MLSAGGAFCRGMATPACRWVSNASQGKPPLTFQQTVPTYTLIAEHRGIVVIVVLAGRAGHLRHPRDRQHAATLLQTRGSGRSLQRPVACREPISILWHDCELLLPMAPA